MNLDKIVLSPRLSAVASMVDKGSRVIDVGTDHAYIPIYLTTNGIVSFASASDIKKGPLDVAQKNILKYGVADKINLILTSGLQSVCNKDYDCIIIAGMGGEMICSILEADLRRFDGQTIILQPMRDVALVRKYLYENSFDIIAETLAREEDKIYNIIKAVKSTKQKYDDFDIYFGRMIVNSPVELLKMYIEKHLKKIKRRIDGLKRANSDNSKSVCKLNLIAEIFREADEKYVKGLRD